MLDKDLKVKISLIQKLRNNNLIKDRQVVLMSYEQGKKLKLTSEEDRLLSELCEKISNKNIFEFFTINKDKKEVE